MKFRISLSQNNQSNNRRYDYEVVVVVQDFMIGKGLPKFCSLNKTKFMVLKNTSLACLRTSTSNGDERSLEKRSMAQFLCMQGRNDIKHYVT